MLTAYFRMQGFPAEKSRNDSSLPPYVSLETRLKWNWGFRESPNALHSVTTSFDGAQSEPDGSPKGSDDDAVQSTVTAERYDCRQMTEKTRLRESQDAPSGSKSDEGGKRGADSRAPSDIPDKRANLGGVLEMEVESDSARKREQALREALDSTLDGEFCERLGIGNAAKGAVRKARERLVAVSGANNDQPTLDLTGTTEAGTKADRAAAKTHERPAPVSGAVDDQATPVLTGTSADAATADRAVATTGEKPATVSEADDEQATLDMTDPSEPDNHYKVEAVRDAIAAEWALKRPRLEKIENAFDLALFFYRNVMKGDTRQTLGLASIEGFQRDIRREVLDLLRPDDELTGVKRALLIISTLGRDKGWKWADDVTLALFVCENEGFVEKAREIGKSLPMLIDRRKLAALRKMFS